jgi:hypothetical protein
MSEPSARRLGRLFGGRQSFPSERDWERSNLLEPRTAPRDPELISDGAGLPFAPTRLGASVDQLDRQDPAVAALISQLARQKGPEPATPRSSLDGWRLLARADDEVLFGHGRPPQLVTVAVRRDARRRGWTCLAVSSGRPLRATRDGVRASGWRIDPHREPDPRDAVVRVLVTEQTWSGGTRADRRLLAPNLHVSDDELVLTMFVTPRGGFQVRSPNPETLARVTLPGPLGQRRLIDGALYGAGTSDGTDSPDR